MPFLTVARSVSFAMGQVWKHGRKRLHPNIHSCNSCSLSSMFLSLFVRSFVRWAIFSFVHIEFLCFGSRTWLNRLDLFFCYWTHTTKHTTQAHSAMQKTQKKNIYRASQSKLSRITLKIPSISHPIHARCLNVFTDILLQVLALHHGPSYKKVCLFPLFFISLFLSSFSHLSSIPSYLASTHTS